MHHGRCRVGSGFCGITGGRSNQLFLVLQIELPESLWRDFPGRKIEGDLAITQTDDAFKACKCNIDLMQRHHQRDAARALLREENP